MPDEGLIARIRHLTKERNAVILAHNYESPEVQDLADYVGDSLGLSRLAAQTKADVIVFCGVHFMAETAAILSPRKTVLLPDINAGCPMANMLTARQLREFKAAHPGAVVVTYVNSTAEVKALSDICCTSANAVAVVQSIPANTPVIFAPDRNLGHYVGKTLGRELILWDGYCPTHERMLPEIVAQAQREHPGALLLVHPECRPDVVAMGDYVGSTTGIIKYCRESAHREFIIATECGIMHSLKKENPDKVFFPASPIADCVNMKLCTPQKILWALEDMAPVVQVDPEVARLALAPIEKMLEISG